MRSLTHRPIYAASTLAVLILVALGIGCDNSRTSSSNTAPQASGGTPAAAASKTNTFTGRITRADGNPIDLKTAKISLEIHGVSTQSGQNVRYYPKVNEQGYFQTVLTEGMYRPPTAEIEIPFKGGQIKLPLARVPDDADDRDSKNGIVQNFVWKLSGPNRDNADPRNHTHWHGGTVGVNYRYTREDLDKRVPNPPPGTRVIFTLAPKGPVIDGSPGQIVTFERRFKDDGESLDNYNLCGIPVGAYTLAAEEVLLDGQRRACLFRQSMGKYVPSMEIGFDTSRLQNIEVTYVTFTRAMP